MALLFLAPGCKLLDLKSLWHKERGPVAVVRIHIESDSSAAGTTQDISVMRAQPVTININSQPILTEADLTAARVLEEPGGFAIALQFADTSAWTLEQYTASNPGKHLVIFGQWSDKLADGRWLAAPLITHRIANGKLIFTPDASRDEADKLVKGLNSVSKKNAGLKSK